MPRPSPRPRRAAAAAPTPAASKPRRKTPDAPPLSPSAAPRKARRSAVFAPEYRAMLAALRAARREAGLTLKDVAGALGRPISFVSKCETGERRLDPIDLWRLAGIYGRPVTDFLPPPAAHVQRPAGGAPTA